MKSIFAANVPFSPKKLPFFYGWIILFASSIGIVASIPGQTMGFSVFTEILVESLQLSDSAISAAYLVGTVTAGLFLPAVGKLFDRIGARKLGTLICLLMGTGLLYLSQVDRITDCLQSYLSFIPHSIFAFVVVGAGFFWLRFTGQGALTMTSRSMLGKWFNRKRGLALSISGIVVSFSFSLAPRVLDLMIQSLGWRWTWASIGLVLSFFMSFFVWFLYRDNPEECDLIMDGSPSKKTTKNKNNDLVIYKDFTREEALKTYSFWVFNLALGIHSFTITGYTFHVVSVANDIGVTRDIILQAFVPASVIGIVLSLIGGLVNPYLRLKYILMILPVGGVIFSYSVAFYNELTPLLIIISIGMCGGTFGLTSGLVWPRFFGRKHLGAISGVGMATMVYASAAAPLAFSLTKDFTGSYKPVFITLIFVYGLFAVASLFADNPQRKLAN